MAWQPKGNCCAFYEKSIAAHAPSVSGVYALYNFDYQLFIGESANVRAALLQHLAESDCHPAPFQPTGFAFEVCSAELRALKARQLIAEHHPVRQIEWLRADSWDADANRQVEASYVFSAAAENQFDREYHTAPASDAQPVIHKRFYFAQGQVAALIMTFAISLTFIFFLGILTGESIQKKASAGYETPLVRISAAAPLLESASTAKTFVEQTLLAEDRADTPAQIVKAPPEVEPQVKNLERVNAGAAPPVRRNYAVFEPVTPGGAAESYLDQATSGKKPASYRAEGGSGRENPWTVQLAASREKTFTQEQVARLKAKGYDGYMVETERDGQTWYRVRVGRFGTRGEAETLRQILATQEGYRTPYITND